MPKGGDGKRTPSTRTKISPSGVGQLLRRYKTAELTLDELKVKGAEAARLLGSDVYQDAVDMTIELLVEGWLEETDPQAREECHRMTRALAMVNDMLAILITQAEDLNLTEEEKNLRDLQRYDDEQGFGVDFDDDPAYLQ